MKQQRFTITRRHFLKQGAAFGLAGAGVMSAGVLSLPSVARTGRSTGSTVAPVYVFASDPRAALPGFRTIPG